MPDIFNQIERDFAEFCAEATEFINNQKSKAA